MSTAAYLRLGGSRDLAERARQAHALRDNGGCRSCPRGCGADRGQGETGVCGLTDHAVVAAVTPWFADEACLAGTAGTGAVFFAGCTLGCVLCRTPEVSHHPGVWRKVDTEELAAFMTSLKARGMRTLSLVTPSHVVPEILSALAVAVECGFDLPLVYQSSSYDGVECLKALEGVVDIYVPSFKFSDPQVSDRLANAPDYPEMARKAILEMHRQVGDLEIDGEGRARRGLLVRHPVLPGGLAGTAEMARFLAGEVSPGTVVNVLGTYEPPASPSAAPPLDRRPTRDEIVEAKRVVRAEGLSLLEDGLESR